MILSSFNILVSNNILHWCQNICKYIQVVISHGTSKASATFVTGNLLLRSGHWSLNSSTMGTVISTFCTIMCTGQAPCTWLPVCLFMLCVCYLYQTEREIFTRVTPLAYLLLSPVILCFCPITTITTRAPYEVPYQYILDVSLVTLTYICFILTSSSV